ncbi:MAG: hypothetical protein ACRDZ7_01625, partial [Acidimicrobiia bacterium]
MDADGAVKAGFSRPTPFAECHGGGVEMEGSDLEGAIAELLADIGAARPDVAGVGVAGMAESGLPLAEGHPLGPVIAWFDGRGEETVAELAAELGPALPLRIG